MAFAKPFTTFHGVFTGVELLRREMGVVVAPDSRSRLSHMHDRADRHQQIRSLGWPTNQP
jgi:hypothetical protein